jgi:hypothetical protein
MSIDLYLWFEIKFNVNDFGVDLYVCDCCIDQKYKMAVTKDIV